MSEQIKDMKDEELRDVIISEASRAIPFIEELHRRGYKITIFLSRNFDLSTVAVHSSKHAIRCHCTKELK